MKIGFIGLGTMGRGMAANLQKAGFDLVVHDVNRQAASPYLEKGATWADSPLAMAAACDLVFTALPTPADVEAVCAGEQGLAKGFRKGAAWFDFSTNAVDVVRRLQAQLIEQEVDFLDAPISGGPAGAASGKLSIWVGGDRAVYDRCKPVLDTMGDQVSYIGLIGAGTIAKLVHNCASNAICAVLTEVFTMAAKAGLEPVPLWEAIRQGAMGRQRSFDKMGTRVLLGKFDPPAFALRLVHKDVQLALQLAREVNVPMRMCNLMGQEISEALNRGWGNRDAMVYTLLQQERAGIAPFEVSPDEIKAVLARDEQRA